MTTTTTDPIVSNADYLRAIADGATYDPALLRAIADSADAAYRDSLSLREAREDSRALTTSDMKFLWMQRQRDAWRDYARHLHGCRTCAGGDEASCFHGRHIKEWAETVDAANTGAGGA